MTFQVFQHAKVFNNYYVNTVEINSGNKLLQIINLLKDDISAIGKIINTDQDHSSAKQISTIEPWLFLNQLSLLKFEMSLTSLIPKKLFW